MKSFILGITIVSLLLSGTVGEAVETEGLVLYLPFDEGSGDTVKDLSDSRNDGTINGAEWLKDGKIGAALSFDAGDYKEKRYEPKYLQILLSLPAHTQYAMLMPVACYRNCRRVRWRCADSNL